MISTAETLATLISFPTVSADSNEALIRWSAGRITAAGGRIHIMAGAKPGKFNMLASFGPETGVGIVLSGHSDVVPVAGQAWNTDPFILTAKGRKLYGRGSSDMKGFLASALSAAARADKAKLVRPLHLAFSYDEEVGCIGIRDLLARLAKENFQAEGCIIGEPTEQKVALGHKGKLAGCIRCIGLPAHSANPSLGCNAISLAAEMVCAVHTLQAELAESGAHDNAYPFPSTSAQVGTIKGGTALNIVPEFCELQFEIRNVAGDAPRALVERLRGNAANIAAHHGKGRITIEITNEYPGLDTPENDAFAQKILRAASSQPAKIGFGTEGGLFKEMLHLPVVVCGPGSIDRAHKPDEYVTQDELDACDAFLDRVIAGLYA
ncbi:MAG: acetylornithine deacetylase [Rhodospirillales bacterium]|nr:acetylornithine deacetylase [Rhodospirillales bacterium]MDE2391742.1 acetylornithine deacetylase [Rhodospirillales bacterium]MDE2457889.1 acetylornithine deacetylase [Rhodospirillales bacterium]